MEPNIPPLQQNTFPQEASSSIPPSINPKKKPSILLWSIIGILSIVIIVVVGYFFLYRSTAREIVGNNNAPQKTVGDIPPINDSDLRLPIDESAADCSVIPGLVATSSSELVAYVLSTSTAKASPAVQNIIQKYSAQVKAYIQGGAWTETVTMEDTKNTFCNLNSARNSANIALANAKYLAENKKIAEAQMIISGVLNTTQQIEDHSGSIIGYLVSISEKGNAISLLLSLKSRGLINADVFRSTLSQYSENKIGQKKALQYEYSIIAQSIDDIAADKYDSPLLAIDGSSSETLALIQKNKNSYNYEPNNSKLMYYTSYKSMYSNVDLPCGSTYTHQSIPQFDPTATTSENYIGKVLASTNLVSFDGINTKRCNLEAQFAQF